MSNAGKLEKFYREKNILVPGGAGFIGSNLAGRLVSYGANVTICDPLDRRCGGNMFNIKDIKDKVSFKRKRVESFIESECLGKFSVIFNCIGLANHHIGLAHVDTDYDINCASALAILRKMADEKIACRMISLGSRSQYGTPPKTDVREGEPMMPLDIQAVHKTALEHYQCVYAHNYGLDLKYVRLTNVYGPGQRMKGDGVGLMAEMIRSALSHDTIEVFGGADRIKDILFIDDVVDALLRLGMIKTMGFSVFNLGGSPHSLKEILEALSRYEKIKVRVKPFPVSVMKMDTGDVVLNTDLFKEATGWKPIATLEKGLGATFNYYKNNRKYYFSGL